MAYVVNNSRGQIIAVVQDGTVNNTATSQTLVGKNVTPYGEYEIENLVHQLENFANNIPPSFPIEGQLWYDTSDDCLKIFIGAGWKPVSGVTTDTQAPDVTPVPGDLWFNPTTQQLRVYTPINTGFGWSPVNNVAIASSAPSAVAAGQLYYNSNSGQLFLWDGVAWELIGPEGVAGFAATKWSSSSLPDTGSVTHAVLLGESNGTVVSIVTADSFTILEASRPTGFVSLVPGINMAAGSVLNGRATQADQLTTARTINGVAFNGTSNITIPLNSELTPGSYIEGSPFSGTVPQTWNVEATNQNLANKIVARDNIGDFAARVITAELNGNITGTATNVTGLVTASHGGTGHSTYNIGDILIGNGNTLNKGTISGSGPIEVVSSDQGIVVSYVGGTGAGSVTSVGINVGNGLGVSGSPITSSGNIDLVNTGVIRVNGGNGINVDRTNGNVTITNTGVLKLVAGNNILLTPSVGTGEVTITATPGLSGVAKIIAGTAMSVTPAAGSGNVTINNTGVTRIIAGSNITLSPPSGNGEVTINSTGGGGGGGGSPPGGANTAIQFNNAGIFGGVPYMTYSNVDGGRYLALNGNSSVNGAAYYTYSGANVAATGINTLGSGAQANLFVAGWVGASGSKLAIEPGSNGNIQLVTSGTGKVKLGSATGLQITGGQFGQVLTTDGNGNVSWSSSGGAAGVTSIRAGDGILASGVNGGNITGTGTIAVDSSVIRVENSQTMTGVKRFVGGVISQAYNFSPTGNSIYWTGPDLGAQWPWNEVTIAVDNTFSTKFYKKRMLVEGDGAALAGEPASYGGVISGVDTGLTGAAGVMGVHTQSVPGLGIGTGAVAVSGSFTGAVFQGAALRPKSSAYVHFRSYSGGGDPVFQVDGEGNVTADGTYTSPCADYAEFFEWADGNPEKQDRRGRSVALVRNKIRLVQPGDTPIGVVSVTPGIIGDAQELSWQDKYLRNEWGETLTEPYFVYQWPDDNGVIQSINSFDIASGTTIPTNAVRVDVDGLGNPLVRPVINPAYDSSIKYIPRSQRPEWSPIGLLGKLKVLKGQPTGSTWIKLRDITDQIEEWLVK